jgi:hypothetical protein
MGDRILHNESLHSLRVCQGHAKADRPTIVLHIEHVVRQTERLREAVHQLSDMVKGISELFWVGPIAVSETRIVGRNQMVVVCEPRQQRLKHPR